MYSISPGFKQELEAVEAGLQAASTEESLEDLQLQAARKLRQLLSTHRELLIHEVHANLINFNKIQFFFLLYMVKVYKKILHVSRFWKETGFHYYSDGYRGIKGP